MTTISNSDRARLERVCRDIDKLPKGDGGSTLALNDDLWHVVAEALRRHVVAHAMRDTVTVVLSREDAEWIVDSSDDPEHYEAMHQGGEHRGALLRAIRAALDAPAPETHCTPLSAGWCPVHGDCTCPQREVEMDSPTCPLHSSESTHGDAPPVPDAPAPEPVAAAEAMRAWCVETCEGFTGPEWASTSWTAQDMAKFLAATLCNAPGAPTFCALPAVATPPTAGPAPDPDPVPVKVHDPAIERAKEVAREDLALLFRVANQRRQRIGPTVTEAQAALSLVCQHIPAHDGDELDNAVGVLERLVSEAKLKEAPGKGNAG